MITIKWRKTTVADAVEAAYDALKAAAPEVQRLAGARVLNKVVPPKLSDSLKNVPMRVRQGQADWDDPELQLSEIVEDLRWKYTTAGAYPQMLVRSASCYCVNCANELRHEPGDIVDVNWENPELYCAECDNRIESAYAEERKQ